MASVDPAIAPTAATTPSSTTAWELLHMAYTNKINTRIFNLCDQLQNIQKAFKFVTEYLQNVRFLSDVFKVVGSPVQDDELIVKILRILGPEYREISASIRARDSSLSFKELFQKLTDHELFLKHQYLQKSSSNNTGALAQRLNMPAQSNGNNRRCNKQQWNQSASRQSNYNNQQWNQSTSRQSNFNNRQSTSR